MDNKSSRPAGDFAEPIHRGRTPHRQHGQTYSKEKIEEGLKVVAEHLASKGLNVTIVAVGGAVNTVLLRSRASTRDVDYFFRTKNPGFKESNFAHEVLEGGRVAEKNLKMSSQWLDNHTAFFIEETVNDLYDQSIKQNEKVFTAKGLTVYAAPWHYAMMTKLDCAAKPQRGKPYDMTDAVDYLGCLIESRDGHAVRQSELEAWTTRYKLSAPAEGLIKDLAEKYKERYKIDGVVDG